MGLDALPDDAWLRWAVLIAIGLAAVSALLMLQVLQLSELAARRRHRRAAFEQRWLPRLAGASLDDAVDGADAQAWTAPARADHAWFLMAWCQMQYRLRGAAHERLNRLLRRFGLQHAAVGLLDHRNGSMQLLGLACLRHLADPAHWDAVATLLQDPRPIQSLAAAEVLVAVDPARAMALVAPLAAKRRDWAPARVAMLCRQAGPGSLTGPLLDLLSEPLRPGARERLLGMLAFGNPLAMAGWARDTLGDGAPRADTIAALGVLADLCDPRDRDRLLPWLADDDPGVRLAALGALHAQATLADLDRLSTLLSDGDWSVRQAAADAIATLPGLRPEMLADVRGKTADRYGRDALDRAIAELAP